MRELLTRTGDYGCPAAEATGARRCRHGTPGRSTCAPRPPPARSLRARAATSAPSPRGSRSAPYRPAGAGPGLRRDAAAGQPAPASTGTGRDTGMNRQPGPGLSRSALLAAALRRSRSSPRSAPAVAWLRGWQPGAAVPGRGLVPADAGGLAGRRCHQGPVTRTRGRARGLAAWPRRPARRRRVQLLPLAVPAGLAAAGWAWSRRLRSMAARAGGRSPGAAVSFDQRQWRHQVRSRAGQDRGAGRGPAADRPAATSWPARSSARSATRPASSPGCPPAGFALAPDRDRRHRHRQDARCCSAVGRVHGGRPAAARGRAGRARRCS